ncbi:BatD family protein [Rhizobium rhizogenes]|uniref:BatD family protein n=1 Tax=Rhizobium rhizogenes TaxID=359 RepID=UPI00067407D4
MLIAVAVLLMTARIALAAEPFAQASVDGKGDLVPGQQVHISVDIFVPDFFTSPPQYSLFELPNAVVTLPDERAQNLIRTVDGVQYSGIRRRYAVVPEAPGNFTLPEISIPLGYSRDGNPVKFEVKVPPVTFTVEGISGGSAQAQALAFAARGLQLDQSFDRDPAKLTAGDAFVRTITVFAEDTQAMLIPPVDIKAASGLRQYENPPRLEDNARHDTAAGSSRTQTVVYTADKAGNFDIPAITFSWFDIDGHKTQSASLPELKVTVSDVPPSQHVITPQVRDDARSPAARHALWLAPALLGVAIASMALLIWLSRLIIAWIEKAKKRRSGSLRGDLKRLRRIIHEGDDIGIYAALSQWAARLGHRSIAAWVSSEESQELAAQVETLELRLFRSGVAEIDRKRLSALIDIRPARERGPKASRLPELNPTLSRSGAAADVS